MGCCGFNPFVAIGTSFASFLSATEEYILTNRDFSLLEQMQQNTLSGFLRQSESFEKTADNSLALWKHKGCDKL